MIENCMYCSLSSSGEHEVHCPNSPSKYNKSHFLDALNLHKDIKIELDEDEVLIRRYVELMTAYMMTSDMVDSAVDAFSDKLSVILNYIWHTLEAVVDEMIVRQEFKKNGK